MTIENITYLCQQIGAILLPILLIYTLYQWIRKSFVREEALYIMLLEAKRLRQEKWERSLEILSSFDKGHDISEKQTPIRVGFEGNKSPYMCVKYAVKMTNGINDSEVMSVLTKLRCNENISNSALALDMEG
jgi:hypothetical protein